MKRNLTNFCNIYKRISDLLGKITKKKFRILIFNTLERNFFIMNLNVRRCAISKAFKILVVMNLEMRIFLIIQQILQGINQIRAHSTCIRVNTKIEMRILKRAKLVLTLYQEIRIHKVKEIFKTKLKKPVEFTLASQLRK